MIATPAPVTVSSSSRLLAAERAGEYLTFRLGSEEYGIDILRVQEIRSYEQPTRLAHSPDFIKGVIDLRGRIVPILDLRLKLQCPKSQLHRFHGGHHPGHWLDRDRRGGGRGGRCGVAGT